MGKLPRRMSCLKAHSKESASQRDRAFLMLDRDLQALIRLSRCQLARLETKQRHEDGHHQQCDSDNDQEEDEDGLLWDLTQRTREVTSLLEDLRPSSSSS